MSNYNPTVQISTQFNKLKVSEAPSVDIDVVRKLELDNQKATIDANINALNVAYMSTDTVLNNRIDMEIERAQAKELELEELISEQVANLVDSAPDALNTLSELANALSSDENFATTMTSTFASVTTRVSEAEDKAEEDKSELCEKINDEVDRAESAEAALTTALNSEVSRAEAAENALTTALNSEVSRAESAEAAISGDYISKHNSLTSEVSANKSALEAADASIDTRVSDAEDAHSSLSSEVSANKSSTAESMVSICDKVTAEQNRAIGKEAALSVEIDAEESARIAAVASEATRAMTAENQIISDLSEAEASIDARVSTEVANRTSADAVLQTHVDNLDNNKLNKVDGVGEGKHQFDEIKITGANDHCYLRFGHWRLKGATDGSALLFQYNSNPDESDDENNVWKTGVPFILN